MDFNGNARWRQRFRVPAIAWSSTAAQQPTRGLVCSNRDGRYQLYAWDVPTGRLRQATHQPTDVTAGAISADGERIYYLHASQGSGIGHYHLVPFAGGEAVDISPDMPPYASFYFTEAGSGAYYGFNTLNQYGFMVFVIDNREGGLPLFRYESQTLAVGPLLSYDGEICVVASSEDERLAGYRLEAYDVHSGHRLGELWDGPAGGLQPVGFATRPGDMRLLATARRDGVTRLLTWDPRQNARSEVPLSTLHGEVSAVDWSRDGRTVLLHERYQAATYLHRCDLETGEITRLDAPAGTHQADAYFTADGTIFTHWQDATHPPRVLELDAHSGRQQRTVLHGESGPPCQPWRSVTFPAADGTPVQAWLATPADAEPPYPAVVHAHGGPSDVMTEVYHPESQAWIDHGFAFFSVNYRGSTTFDSGFEEALLGQPGALETSDLAAGARWLVTHGVAQPAALFVTGGSYGGTLALLALAHAADLWAGAMSQAAITDWAQLYAVSSEPLRDYMRQLFQGTPAEREEAYRQASPITHAGAIRAPVLLLQGRDDPRCPQQQAERFAARLREHEEGAVEIQWYDASAGRSADQRIHHQEIMLRFAHEVLGRG